MRQGHIALGIIVILFVLLCACAVSAAPVNAGTTANSQVSGTDSVIGEWKGNTATRNNQHIEYSLDCYPGGNAEIDIDRQMGNGYDQDMTYYGTWTKAAEPNTYKISTGHGASYTLTLTSATLATLATPDSGSVMMYLTERYYPRPTYASSPSNAPPSNYRYYDDDWDDRYDRDDWDDRYDYDDYYDWD